MSAKQIGQRKTNTGFGCPKCGKATAVIDSREGPEGTGTWRRRRGCACGYKFTTYETSFSEAPVPMVMLESVMEKIGAARFHAERAVEAAAALLELAEMQREIEHKRYGNAAPKLEIVK